MSPVVEAAKEYAAGFAAGVATVITGHPFDTVKGEIQNNRPQLQVIIPSAAFAGALISFILCPTELVKVSVLPLDVAKTVIQTAPDPTYSRNPLQTLNASSQFLQIYKRVGLSGCYAGLGPTLARAFPANAVAIVTWELTAKFLGIRRD
ncbi:hypothetical protein GW17_00020434 [Ensete ventricosum]|nr:hypothetical protein GW17_00020434 [Ensete ventricosum]RZS08917.1 hypothetical protein BHM03_00039947 [Ensete ventricosum]